MKFSSPAPEAVSCFQWHYYAVESPHLQIYVLIFFKLYQLFIDIPVQSKQHYLMVLMGEWHFSFFNHSPIAKKYPFKLRENTHGT